MKKKSIQYLYRIQFVILVLKNKQTDLWTSTTPFITFGKDKRFTCTKILTIVMKLEISNKLDVLVYRRLLWINVTSG